MLTRRRLPPFAAVRAFEAAARHLSFTAASQELHVTQSAISHQVKRLEEFLDVPLFLRHAHGIELTEAGRAYLRELTDVLDRLDSSTRRLFSPGKPEALRIRATPAFASRWLVPRMHRFYAEYPDIEWHVSTGGRVAKLVEIGRRWFPGGMVGWIRRRGQGRSVSGRGSASRRPGAG